MAQGAARGRGQILNSELAGDALQSSLNGLFMEIRTIKPPPSLDISPSRQQYVGMGWEAGVDRAHLKGRHNESRTSQSIQQLTHWWAQGTLVSFTLVLKNDNTHSLLCVHLCH